MGDGGRGGGGLAALNVKVESHLAYKLSLHLQ